MEKISFCLDSDDGWVQEEGILKLCEILKEAGPDVCESAEFGRLTEQLTARRPSVARRAAVALVQLVRQAVVPLPAALRATLTSVAVDSSGDCLVWTVTELVELTLLAAAGGQKAASPLTGAYHPHVKLLRALPLRWPQLVVEVERLLLADTSVTYRDLAVEYVSPLLWASCGQHAPAGLRHGLVAALCRLARLSRSSRPVLRALGVLARLRAPADQLAWELPALCRLLVDFALEVDDRALLRALTPLSVCCLKWRMTEGLSDVTSAVDDVRRLLELGLGGDVELILLSDIISQSSALSLLSGQLIETAVLLLERGRWSAPELAAATLLAHTLRDTEEERQPELALALLRALPELAVNKTLVPRIVRLLTGLVSAGGLLAPEAVRLLTALWRREARCLPYLLDLAAIADICQHNPSAGKDQLSVLSRVLTELGDAPSAAACSLALTGIAALCRAQLLDVRTTWRILAPQLRQERRPAVLARYMEFLGLVPQLHVPSEEYEVFTRQVAAVLWQRVAQPRPESVARAALRALAEFKPGTFQLKMLPAAARQGLVVPAKLIATPADAAKRPEDLLNYVPGECFTLLLSVLPPRLLSEYGLTLTALVRREVQLIGRGVYFTAKERSRREGGEPASLSYLEPSSILRALVVRLQQTADSGALAAGKRTPR
ncbi:focadhesin-like [Pollicipes pollicipes]|uniref:focadhesin-like n=1 Tax=Pollicipes pollicipes TaxID=41117 RepID=UPI001884A8F2|nr:focadhesin-like [Pollicipes pollicipes]